MRPTKYSKEIQEKADHYVDNHEQYGDLVPTVAGLAIQLGTVKKTIYNWSDQHDKFLHTLGRLNQRQEHKLAMGGLGNEMNANIVKLMLANHNYSDKVQQEVSSPDGSLKPTHIILEGVSANTSTDT